MDVLRILLADDDADHRQLLHRALTQRGDVAVTMIAVENRDALLAAIRNTELDCIILDYNLGCDLASDVSQELRKLVPQIPVLVVSSSTRQDVVIDSIRNGVVDFVPKSAAMEHGALLDRVRHAVSESRRRVSDRRAASRRWRQLVRLCETDALTGLPNRRCIRRLLSSARNRSDRRAHTIVAMVDLDHFKVINDTWGHHNGDVALRLAAEALRTSLPRSSVLARWGGEEFLALIPSVSLAEGWLWAERARRALASIPGPWLDQARPITASFGVDLVPNKEVSESSLLRVDRALYWAKESGRDRVCTWDTLTAFEAAECVQMEPGLNPGERLDALVKLLRPRLQATQAEHIGPHSNLVGELAVTIGRRAGFSRDDLEALDLAARYHDIGKVCIPEELLTAPRPLSPEERRLINEHARLGAELVRACGLSEKVVELVALHHRRYDASEHRDAVGRIADTGERLAGLLNLADSVVTMTSKRPYGRLRTYAEAMHEVDRERGHQFDPELANFLDRSRPRQRLAA